MWNSNLSCLSSMLEHRYSLLQTKSCWDILESSKVRVRWFASKNLRILGLPCPPIHGLLCRKPTAGVFRRVFRFWTLLFQQWVPGKNKISGWESPDPLMCYIHFGFRTEKRAHRGGLFSVRGLIRLSPSCDFQLPLGCRIELPLSCWWLSTCSSPAVYGFV